MNEKNAISNFKTMETGDGGTLLCESLENEQSTLKRKLSSTSLILDGDATASILNPFETNDVEDDIKSKSVNVNGLQLLKTYKITKLFGVTAKICNFKKKHTPTGNTIYQVLLQCGEDSKKFFVTSNVNEVLHAAGAYDKFVLINVESVEHMIFETERQTTVITNVIPISSLIDINNGISFESGCQFSENQITTLIQHVNMLNRRKEIIGKVESLSNSIPMITGGDLTIFFIRDETGLLKVRGFRQFSTAIQSKIQNGMIIGLCNTRICVTNPRYAANYGHTFEVELANGTQIKIYSSPPLRILNMLLPVVQMTPISQIVNLEFNSSINVAAFVVSVDPVEFINSKFGSNEKQTISLLDESGTIQLTVWKQKIRSDDLLKVIHSANTILPTPMVFHNVRVTSFNGVSLSTTTTTEFEPLLDLKRQLSLQQWYAKNGNSSQAEQNLTDVKWSVDDLTNCAFHPALRTVDLCGKISVLNLGDLTYEGCEKCFTKWSNSAQCSSCKQSHSATRIFRIRIMIVDITDETRTVFATMFDPVATQFIGSTSVQIASKEENDIDSVSTLLTSLEMKPWNITLQRKFNKFNSISLLVRKIIPI